MSANRDLTIIISASLITAVILMHVKYEPNAWVAWLLSSALVVVVIFEWLDRRKQKQAAWLSLSLPKTMNLIARLTIAVSLFVAASLMSANDMPSAWLAWVLFNCYAVFFIYGWLERRNREQAAWLPVPPPKTAGDVKLVYKTPELCWKCRYTPNLECKLGIFRVNCHHCGRHGEATDSPVLAVTLWDNQCQEYHTRNERVGA